MRPQTTVLQENVWDLLMNGGLLVRFLMSNHSFPYLGELLLSKFDILRYVTTI